jgi:exonuclease SbcD
VKILHTSDWHIGRSFHGYSTIPHLESVLDALVEAVSSEGVDVVVISGDIFDSATPSAEAYDTLTRALTALKTAGATVVLTSGNHDSATRLGFNSGFTGLAGIHIITSHQQHDQPITVTDDDGPVHFYGIPYLEPSLVRHHYPDVSLRSHADVLGFVMGRIRADLAERGGRSVVLSHAFIADIPAESSDDLLRDITSGGLDLVPLATFDGPDYVALGHIHGRAELSERVRYSGAPLHYSFGEAAKPRGGWLVELDGNGLSSVRWLDLPVPRRLTVLTGELDTLLADAANSAFENDWVSAILTDRVRPLDAMRRLQSRFPYAAHLEYRPAVVADSTTTSYSERIARKSDPEIVDDFLALVRNGVGASDAERSIIADTLAQVGSGETS